MIGKLLDLLRHIPEMFYLRTLLAEERRKAAALEARIRELETKLEESQRETATAQAQSNQLREQLGEFRKRSKSSLPDRGGPGGWMSR